MIAKIVAAVITIGLATGALYLLWNGSLVGAVDGVHEITFLQAFGLSILARILFKPDPPNPKTNDTSTGKTIDH